MHARLVLLLTSLVLGALCRAAAAQCGGWIHDSYTYGVTFAPGTHGKGVVWDIDGSGGPLLPRLVLASRSAPTPLSGNLSDIVLRTPSGWDFLGSRLPLLYGTARLVVISASGGALTELFALGTPNGSPSNQTVVFRWTGSDWTTHGPALPGEPRDATTWDPDGSGPAAPRIVCIARGGSTSTVHELLGGVWQRIGTIAGDLRALHTWDPDGDGPLSDTLIVAGYFYMELPGGGRNEGVAAWNGTAWSPLGTGVRGPVNALASWHREGLTNGFAYLVAGGTFTATGSGTINRLAKWDGAGWSPVSSGSPVEITALGVAPSPGGPRQALVVGGRFAAIGGITSPHCALFDGFAWFDTGSGPTDPPTTFLWWDPDGPLNEMHYAGPTVAAAWHDPASAPRTSVVMSHYRSDGIGRSAVTIWDGRRITEHPRSVFAGVPGIKALMPWRPPSDPDAPEVLVIGGGFDVSDDRSARARCIATWNGEKFLAFPEPLTDEAFYSEVTLLRTFDPDGNGPSPRELIASGDFAREAPTVLRNIARWNGETWRSLGGHIYGNVYGLESWDADGAGPGDAILFACGSLSMDPQHQTHSRFASWNGSEWTFNPMPTLDTGAISMSLWDRDGPGPLPQHPAVGFKAVGPDYWPGCDPMDLCPLFVDIKAHAWTGSHWTSIWGFSVSWYLDEPSRDSGASLVTTWDSDGNGPQPADLLIAGHFLGEPATTMYRKTHSEYQARELWGGRVDSEEGGSSASRVEMISPVDFDDDGPIPPILIIGGEIERLTDTIHGREFPIRDFARYMEGPPHVLEQPRISSTSTNDAIGLEIGAIGPGRLTYLWSRNGSPLSPGPTPGGSIVHDVDRSSLIISHDTEEDWGEYRCTVSNACGSVESEPVFLGPSCPANYNGDDAIDILDFLDFIQDFSDCELSPAPCGQFGDADINADTLVDILDFLDFIDSFSNGC
jgi:hypothetical protein